MLCADLGPTFNYGVFLALTSFPAAVLLAERLPILDARVLRWLGARSYSIYLWHPVVYFSTKAFLPGFETVRDEHPLFLIASTITVGLIVSDLGYRFFEVPMRRWIRSRMDAQPIAHAAAQTS